MLILLTGLSLLPAVREDRGDDDEGADPVLLRCHSGAFGYGLAEMAGTALIPAHTIGGFVMGSSGVCKLRWNGK